MHGFVFMNSAINDDYLEGYSFGRQANDDVLLFVVATLTPPYFDDDPPKAKDGSPLLESDEGRLTAAGRKYVADRMESLAYALTRPFNDDDCSYGYEYAEGEMSPLRFVTGNSDSGFRSAATFQWMPYGGECDEDLEEGIGFYDPLSLKFTVAFLITISRCSDPGAYLLFWDHIAPYLAIPDCEVEILAYNDDQSCITVQGYSEGEIEDEHDPVWAQRLLAKFELTDNERRALTLAA